MKLTPVNVFGDESDKDFDIRFKVDRIYEYDTFFWKKRVRLVLYPNDKEISVFETSLRKPTSLFIGESNLYYRYFSWFTTKYKCCRMTKDEIYNKYKINV